MNEKRIGGEPFPENKAVQQIKGIEDGPTPFQAKKAILKRADWLKYCLDIGFHKSQLDGLAKIWDDNHDEFGNLIKGKSEPVDSSMSYSDKDRITELLTVCYNLINSFNGTSKVPPVDLYMPLVDAVTLFDNYDSSKIEPVVSQDQERDTFALDFAVYMHEDSWKYDHAEQKTHSFEEHLNYFKAVYRYPHTLK